MPFGIKVGDAEGVRYSDGETGVFAVMNVMVVAVTVVVGGISVAVEYAGSRGGTIDVGRAIWQAVKIIARTTVDDRLSNRLNHLECCWSCLLYVCIASTNLSPIRFSRPGLSWRLAWE